LRTVQTHRRLVSVWGGFSTHWYTELLHNRADFLQRHCSPLEVAVASSTAAVVLGSWAAIAWLRFATISGAAAV